MVNGVPKYKNERSEIRDDAFRNLWNETNWIVVNG